MYRRSTYRAVVVGFGRSSARVSAPCAKAQSAAEIPAEITSTRFIGGSSRELAIGSPWLSYSSITASGGESCSWLKRLLPQ